MAGGRAPRCAGAMTVRTAPHPSPSRLRVAADGRDLVADVVRSGALLVVVAWHWVFSITHRRPDGSLTMPNPVDEIAGGWLLTWGLQVMPAFFVVSGAVNAASLRRSSGPASAWVGARLRRLGTASAVVLAGCVLFEVGAWALFGTSGWTARHIPVLVPLWTVALLAALTPLTPVLARPWQAAPGRVAATFVGVLAASELARFGLGIEQAGLVSTAAVWSGAYVLGFAYRDVVDGRLPEALGGRLVLGGVGALALLTTWGPYPTSMVATRTDAISNLWPTTAPVLALAAVQAGALIALGRRLHGWLDTPVRRQRIGAVGALGLPVYLLHMFALVLIVHAIEGAGVVLPASTSPGWWLARPVFLVLPALALAPMVAGLRRVLR
jgi:hypothetical protein